MRMGLKTLLLVSLVAATMAAPVAAKEITLKLSDDEQKALLGLLDLAVKQGGLSVSGNANYFLTKIQQASGPAPQVGQSTDKPVETPAADAKPPVEDKPATK